MAEAPTETPGSSERNPDFLLRTETVLPELHWVGAAIREDRFEELADRIPEPERAKREHLEYFRGTADPAVPLAEIRERYDRLAELAEWDPDLFLRTIAGLPERSGKDGSSETLPDPPTEPPDFEALERAREYLALVEEMMEPVELTFDRRQVIQMAPELLHLADVYRFINVETLRTAMHVVEPSYEGDGLNAWDYLRLGELGGARKAVKSVFQGISLEVTNPFFSGPMNHISQTRMESLYGERIDTIGKATAERMRAHIADCTGCGKSWQHLEDRAARAEAIRQGTLRRGQMPG